MAAVAVLFLIPRVDRSCSEGIRTLANNKSAEKRIRVAEAKHTRNRPYISACRTYVKKAELAIRQGDQDAARKAVVNAVSMLDRTARKGIIHKNNAARRKSRLMAKFNQVAASA